MQLELFQDAPAKRARLRRVGFVREAVVCRIGPHWWFANYLVVDDGSGRVVPDLRAALLPTFYQFRA